MVVETCAFGVGENRWQGKRTQGLLAQLQLARIAVSLAC